MKRALAVALLVFSWSIQAGVRSNQADLEAYLKDLCDWTLTLDVGSGALKNTKDTPWSIFINGNLARVLMAGYQITRNQAYLDEALRWADTFVQQQRIVITSAGEEGGYWADAGPTGNIYFGDAGTAATALAMACRFAPPARQQIYQRAMDRYVRFVRQGSIDDPQAKGRGATTTWFVEDPAAQGAIGTGYYKGHLSKHPTHRGHGDHRGRLFLAILRADAPAGDRPGSLGGRGVACKHTEPRGRHSVHHRRHARDVLAAGRADVLR